MGRGFKKGDGKINWELNNDENIERSWRELRGTGRRTWLVQLVREKIYLFFLFYYFLFFIYLLFALGEIVCEMRENARYWNIYAVRIAIFLRFDSINTVWMFLVGSSVDSRVNSLFFLYRTYKIF